MDIAGLVLGLSFISFSSIPVCLSFSQRSKLAINHAIDYYDDKDGEATESSLKAYGDRWSRMCIVGLSLVGLICAFTTAIIVTIGGSDGVTLPLQWGQVAGWVSYSALLTEFAWIKKNRCSLPFNLLSSSRSRQ